MKNLITICSIAIVSLFLFACNKDKKMNPKAYTYILTYDTGYSYSMGQYRPGLGRIIDSTINVIDLRNNSIQIGENIYDYNIDGNYYLGTQRIEVYFSGKGKKWILISHTVGIGTKVTRLLKGHILE